MSNFKNQIITASAGTGKTYRLSLEYIALILRYYEVEGFSLDSILALTFTRKATYEIRERILEHLEILDQGSDADLEKNLCQMLGRSEDKLTIKDRGVILSARRQILNDSRYLQVGTIDSYIGKIFRNIVCPLRSIDEYDIDLSAIDKRMPYLMAHLMQPQFLAKIDKLLSRKVLRSLDNYGDFFASLIQERWLYYLITKRCPQNNIDIPDQDYLELFTRAIGKFCDSLAEYAAAKNEPIAKYLNKPLSQLFASPPESGAALYRDILQLLDKAHSASSLLSVVSAADGFNKKSIRGELRENLESYLRYAAEALANHLYYQLFIPEQAEILELWKIILDEYDRLIYRYKNMTYDDISWFTFEALFSDEPPNFDLSFENTANEFYHFLSHRTRFLLIDEFQDTSLIQFNILKPIMEEICAGYGSKDFGGMIVVGDEKQSIFGWRKGERDLLLNLRYLIGSLQDVSTDKLDTSYRSTPDLMAFINNIFADTVLHNYLEQKQMNWEYQEVKSGIESQPGRLEYKCAQYSRSGNLPLKDKEDAYNDFVKNMVKPAWDAHPQERIAILCRKNDELNSLQLVLEEQGMGGIFQPSDSIVNHHLVQPLIAWLRFVCYGDNYDLLCFLRSDYLMLSSQALKYLTDALALYQQELKNAVYDARLDLDAYPALAEWFSLAQSQQQMSPYQCLRDTLSLILTNELQKSKRDRLNLEAFLAKVRDWELSQATQGTHLPDLLDFIEDNAAQEEWKQVSVEGEERLQLITIHSAKGLQFDRVFVFMPLGGKGGGGGDQSRKLFWTYRYSQIPDQNGEPISSLHHLDAYALSYHYDNILKQSSARGLWEASERQAILEELNNLYVAITRAKTSLHLYFCYENRDAWPEYFADKYAKDTSKNLLSLLIANACRQYYAASIPDENGIYSIELHADTVPEAQAAEKASTLEILELDSDAIAPAKGLAWEATLPLEENLHQNWQAVYIQRPQHLYGDILHYYLSYILRDTADEHRLALRHCLKRYGSLLSADTIRQLCDKGRQKLQEYSYLFAQDYDKVYTELPVKNYRIDRLLLNTHKKEALVIDYKTGRIHEPEQLENYVQVLKSLPALKDYSFSYEYVMI